MGAATAAAIDAIDIVSIDAPNRGPDPCVGDVLVVRGWAHRRGERTELSVMLDGTREYAVETRLPRPDVAAALDDGTAHECGFTVSVPTIGLHDGEHALAVMLAGPAGKQEVARTRFRLATTAPPAPAELARSWFESWTDEAGTIVPIKGASLRVPPDSVVRIDGWAADTVSGEPAVAAFALVGERIVEVAYGFERLDVAREVGEAHAYCGFSLSFPTTYVPPGGTTFRVTLLAADGVTLRNTDAVLALSCTR